MQDFPEANILATKLLMDVKTTYARIYIRLVDEDNSHLGKTCISFIAVLHCIIVKMGCSDCFPNTAGHPAFIDLLLWRKCTYSFVSTILRQVLKQVAYPSTATSSMAVLLGQYVTIIIHPLNLCTSIIFRYTHIKI